MNKTTYFKLHKDYLLGLDEQTRQYELEPFATVQLHMYNWLQKERGLSHDQAQAIIDHSTVSRILEEKRR
ncbi:hypothetical protein AWH48_00800 [Domibacillus aminovorans]|uniref:Uncharacterized protein n=1 Tax=Domibacillus aminovorans TaxID=29332 RepID=A0A177L2X4_9BACI|nr:hypothetical protein [Domibacillus aminovorans]OAH59677.1 hypothetical protein AWH48_00800 [Domibacillus aminovorans]